MDSASDTKTMSSWIGKYREENGRTYHAFKDGKYWFVHWVDANL
jgi:hypothetical protein